MSLGLGKCAVVHVHKGKKQDTANDLEVISCSTIKHLADNITHKFLGIRQREMHKAAAVKRKLSNEYTKNIREI